ncbi:HEPN domain-containing protein [Candidatus Poribacteria bacterium]|nr:HEPN domain-containing protein [Candidatus Poribacteria bacterium]
MENFCSAASRHWDNSAFLSNHNRHQEAAYLAGYAAECALKALIEEGGLHGRPFRHSLVGLSVDGLELALLLNPLLRRYEVSPVVADTSGLGRWEETHRYEETGFLSEADFQDIVTQANKIARKILVGFTLDGLLAGGDIPQ